MDRKVLMNLLAFLVLCLIVGVSYAQQPIQKMVIEKTPIAKPQPATSEECYSFNLASIAVVNKGGNWVIVDSTQPNLTIASFLGNQKADAELTLDIIKKYRMNQVCFAKPGVAFQYELVSGQAPTGVYAREVCRDFNPGAVLVSNIRGQWKIVEGTNVLFDFGSNEAQARLVLDIIRKHGFTRSCFVGRPVIGFHYMVKGITQVGGPQAPGITSKSLVEKSKPGETKTVTSGKIAIVSPQTQAESKKFQGPHEQVKPVQLPKVPRLAKMIAQRQQQLRTTVDLKRKADLQRLQAEITSIRADMILANMPCDPTSQTPQIRYVYPKEIHPGDPVAIYGCNFGSKDNVSGAVMSAAGSSYGIFWNVDTKSPEYYELKITSWTDNVIKANIPSYDYLGDGIPPIPFGFVDPISVKLEVYKEKKYDDQKGKFVPDKVTTSSPILLKPLMEIRIVQSFLSYIVPHCETACPCLKDAVMGIPQEGDTIMPSIPRVIHFGNCQGKDTILLKSYTLPSKDSVFYDHQFDAYCLEADNTGAYSEHSGCLTPAKLDQDLGNIKGKTSLPDVTVSWENTFGAAVYEWTIWAELPKKVY